jgi:hypothetical protein
MEKLLVCPGCLKEPDTPNIHLDCGHNLCYGCLIKKKKEEEEK